MKKKITLLIYEKDLFLNAILTEQFSYSKNYQIFIAYDEKKLLEMINNRIFDIFILNLDISNKKLSFILKNYKENNEYQNVVAYCVDDKIFKKYKDSNISLLKKPFKFKALLNCLDNIRNSDFIVKKNNYLMDHIQFIPIKKLIYNLHNHHKEYLTEKETYLLDYLNKNRNINIKKADLLKKIWGVTQDINTHTLETHIYRLKLKLNKIEPNLSFSLLNQNGLYCMKDNF